MTESRTNTNSDYLYCGDEEIIVDADAALVDDQHDSHNPSGTRRQVGGAAALGGIAGLVVAGPIIGLVAAGGAAAVATSRGKAGEVARKGGDVVADAGVRLKRFDRKHHVVEKTTHGVKKGCHWVSKQFQPQPQPQPQPGASRLKPQVQATV